jgi:hypothetical protein
MGMKNLKNHAPLERKRSNRPLIKSMTCVPGFDRDIFISYAYGDDSNWIDRLLDRLKPTLARNLLGAEIWIDTDDLRKSCDF